MKHYTVTIINEETQFAYEWTTIPARSEACAITKAFNEYAKVVDEPLTLCSVRVKEEAPHDQSL